MESHVQYALPFQSKLQDTLRNRQMFKNRHYRFSLTKLLALSLISFGQSALAVDLKVSPFALYEVGNKDIVIDQVSTKYGLGVLGFDVDANFQSKLSISGKLGYGANPSQKISFSGANFKGTVKGTYVEGAMQYALWTKSDYSVVSELRFINRNIDAPDLTGSRNGTALTGNAFTSLDSVDLTFGARMPLGNAAFLNISGGLSRWHLKSNATAFFTSGGVSATARKKIDAVGRDPIVKVSIGSNNPKHNFKLELANRSLKSKTSAQIMAIQLDYVFKF